MKISAVTSLERQIGAGPLVESLFWIPTKVEETVIPLGSNPMPGTDISTKCAYLNAVVTTPAMQISISPPLFQFTVRSPFRAQARINSTLNENQKVSVLIYGLLKDFKKFAKLTGGNKIVLKGFLRGNGKPTPEVELHGATPVSKSELTTLDVVYSARGNSAPKDLQTAIYNALQVCIPDAVKALKDRVELQDTDQLIELMNLELDTIQFKTPDEFFWALHLPQSDAHFEAAKKAAKNLGVAEIMRRAQRASSRPSNPESVIPFDRDRANELVRMMGFKLTGDQKIAMKDIFQDLMSEHAMRRLLSGDVGTGKTAVFGVFAAAAQELGKTVAIYIPNGILANQVCSEMRKWWPHIPIKLVTATQKPSKADLLENPILIGTSALLNYWLANMPKEPNLLIVDEQQKSSREQREYLLGEHTNFLEATATCLPRTMGLAVHGSLNISVVSEQPVVKKITSKIIKEAEKPKIFAEIKKTLLAGNRVAIVLPEVEAKLTGDLQQDAENEKKSVVTAVKLWEKMFPGKVVGLHGRMKEAEKIALLDKVKRGDYPIVLATSLIEIGVTIPNLTLILVIHPEKYGASSLHQLRGRLVRNGGEGSFYLLIDEEDASEKTMARLNAVCATSDGFKLAATDFEARGFGDLAEDSSEQSGAPICLFKNIRILPSDVERVVSHLQIEKRSKED